MEIFRIYTFEAAHRLPMVPPGHKCSRVHGHSYRLEVRVRGPIGADTGWIMDLGDIDTVWAPLFAALDHHYLNDVEGLENPTCELIARWIWRRMRASLPLLSSITLHETATAGCVYAGEDEPAA